MIYENRIFMVYEFGNIRHSVVRSVRIASMFVRCIVTSDVIAQHLDHVSSREIVLNPKNHLPSFLPNSHLLSVFPCIIVIRWIANCTISLFWRNHSIFSQYRTMQIWEKWKRRDASESAKRVLNVRRVSRWTIGLRENILANVSPGIRVLVWLSIGR